MVMMTGVLTEPSLHAISNHTLPTLSLSPVSSKFPRHIAIIIIIIVDLQHNKNQASACVKELCTFNQQLMEDLTRVGTRFSTPVKPSPLVEAILNSSVLLIHLIRSQLMTDVWVKHTLHSPYSSFPFFRPFLLSWWWWLSYSQEPPSALSNHTHHCSTLITHSLHYTTLHSYRNTIAIRSWPRTWEMEIMKT